MVVMSKKGIKRTRQSNELDIRFEWTEGERTKAWSDLWDLIFRDIFNGQVDWISEATVVANES
jgi:hypothetical protein